MTVDLRQDYTEKAEVDTGTLYRKGRVVQVWWKVSGKETWTAPDLRNATENYECMKDRWTSKSLKRMTKAELSAKAQSFGREAGFVANVILTWHPKPMNRLRGLVALLENGHEVRIGQAAIDVLIVNGTRHEWTILESAPRA